MPQRSRPSSDELSTSSLIRRFVTPSPRSLSKLIDEKHNEGPTRTILFGNSTRKRATATSTCSEPKKSLQPSSTTKESAQYSPRKIFRSFHDAKNYKVANRKSKVSTRTKISSKPSRGISRRTKNNKRYKNIFAAGDSLLTVTSMTKKNPAQIINEKKTLRKRPQFPTVVNQKLMMRSSSLNRKNEKFSALRPPSSGNKKNTTSTCVPIDCTPLSASRVNASNKNELLIGRNAEGYVGAIAAVSRPKLPRACKNNRILASSQMHVIDDCIDDGLFENIDDNDDPSFDLSQEQGLLSVSSEESTANLGLMQNDYRNQFLEPTFKNQRRQCRDFDTSLVRNRTTVNNKLCASSIVINNRKGERFGASGLKLDNKNKTYIKGIERQQKMDASSQRERMLSTKRMHNRVCNDDTSESILTKLTSLASNDRTQKNIGAELFTVRKQCSQSKQPTRLSSRRQAQQKKQFSLEEYSVYSNHSSNGRLRVQKEVDDGIFSSQAPAKRRGKTRNDTWGDSTKATSKLNTLRKVQKEYKRQTHSSFKKERSLNFHIPDSNAERHKSTLLQRRDQQKKRSPPKVGKEKISSEKRVRFESTTTIFSVEIKIKTNRNAGRKTSKENKDLEESAVLLPALDESTVQAIATQVTQACLTQVATGTKIVTCNSDSQRPDPRIDINVDVNNETDLVTFSTESSCQRIQSNIDEKVFEEESSSCEGRDEGRSITSELTNDWNRTRKCLKPKKSKIRGNINYLSPSDNNRRACKNFVQVSQENTGGYQGLRPNQTLHSANDTSSNIDNQRASPKSHQLASGRRQRMWHCSDSLAGSCADWSKSSACLVSTKIPKEVSMKCSRIGFLKTKLIPTATTVSSGGVKADINCNTEGNDSNGSVVDLNAVQDYESHMVPLSPTHRCGKCKGCRRTLDCQTCNICLEKLHWYRSPPPTRHNSQPCLMRRCQRNCRVGCVDSLLGLASITKSKTPKSWNKTTGVIPVEEHLIEEKTSANYFVGSRTTSSKEMQESKLSKSTKPPWEDSDDWTVDYSYLSNPRNRIRIAGCPGSKKLIRSNAFSSLLVPDGKRAASISSVSNSVLSPKIQKQLSNSSPFPSNKQRRERGSKRKRDPLHGLALPSTSIDASSVTSWRANRKCLRALMEYDEADQEWA